MKPKQMTPEQAQAISNLRNNPDFVVYIDYMGTFAEAVIAALLQNPKLPNPEYHRGIGGGMTEMLGAVEKAPSYLEKFKNQT